jgi:predicted RecA/RadA family phage recombinase
MTIRAAFVQCDDNLPYTPAAALDGGSVVLLPDGRVGVTLTAIAAGVLGAVVTEGILDFNSDTATLFSEGEDVFWDATNFLAVPAGNANASYRVGRATRAKISGDLVVRVLINATAGLALRQVITANGAAVTNTTAETAMASFVIPAGALKQGRIIDYFAATIATSTNGTDTFRYRVRLGGVAGSVVADTGAIDLANNDIAVIAGQVVVREDGASGSIVAAAHGMLKTTGFNTLLDATAVDTTAALTLVLTCTQSAASASNSTRATLFNAIVR